ncbi:MAG: 4-hydroxy-tetrahydrodipicolinate synthase [Candidatus Moduliflexus flocculans]|nr:4-hydroxy-tetrahydrodipicolinate synthase [Candidatus Moduliflexus flocculans]
MKLFQGSGVAIVTPFKDNQINLLEFATLIDWHIEHKTSAIIVIGTTGESPVLSMDEKKLLIRSAVEFSAGRIPIIANTGTNNTAQSIELSLYAQNVGADGLLLVAPYYNKPTQRGLIAHFSAIAQAVELPIILYNVPSRCGVNIQAETVIELSKVANIVGVKEASGNLEQIKEIIDKTGDEFAVYSGNDDQIFDVLALGGDGVISVSANLIPQTISTLCTLFFNGNTTESSELSNDLSLLHKVLFIESNPVPIKAAMNVCGHDVGATRLPLVDFRRRASHRFDGSIKPLSLIG